MTIVVIAGFAMLGIASFFAIKAAIGIVKRDNS